MEKDLFSILEFQPSDRSEIESLLKEKKEIEFSYFKTKTDIPILVIDKQIVFVGLPIETLNTTMIFSSKYLGKTDKKYRLKKIDSQDLFSYSPKN